MEEVDEKNITNKIHELIEVKKTANEDYTYTIDPLLHDYIRDQLIQLEQIDLQKEEKKQDVEVLNLFYRQLLKQHRQ